MAVLYPQDAFSQNPGRRFYVLASSAAFNGGRISSYKRRNAAPATASSLNTDSLLQISHKSIKKTPASVSQKWVRKAPRKYMDLNFEDAFAGSTVEPSPEPSSLPLPGFCTKMNGSLPSSATIPEPTWNRMSQQDDINKEAELKQQEEAALKKREKQRAAPPTA